jgi:hypothetical protein
VTWIELLTRVLDPNGPRRMLLLADQSQEVYERGFTLPESDDGWTRCELAANCRNTFDIASLLRRRFGGAVAPVGGPESEDVRWVQASDLDGAVDAVGDALDALEDRDHAASTMLVATFTRSVRDRLREVHSFVRWEDSDPMAILCETVHRVKGLEFDHVILVVHDDEVRDELLYVGLSRAVMRVTIIGPPAIEARLGFGDGGTS